MAPLQQKLREKGCTLPEYLEAHEVQAVLSATPDARGLINQTGLLSEPGLTAFRGSPEKSSSSVYSNQATLFSSNQNSAVGAVRRDGGQDNSRRAVGRS